MNMDKVSVKKKKKCKQVIDPEFKNLFKPEWFQLPPYISPYLSLRKLRFHDVKKKNPPQMKISKYFESKKACEEIRKKLLDLIRDEELNTNETELPNNQERSAIRYYYYIHQGVDIINIAPMSELLIQNIRDRIPFRLKFKRSTLLDQLLSEVQNEFLLAVKKSIIDFTLQDLITDSCPTLFSQETQITIQKKRESFEMIKKYIKKDLFKIHPTIVKISHLWYFQYRNLEIINTKELSSSEALELGQFSEWLSAQLELCKNIILEKWIPTVFRIISNEMEKKSFLMIKEKKLIKFYSCLSTLMSLQLQMLGCNSIKAYMRFLCDVHKSPGFQVSVLYKNNKIIFCPSYKDFEKVFLNVFDSLVATVSQIPTIEMIFRDTHVSPGKKYLKPSILPEIIKYCRDKVKETLQDEWICPELKIHDFDQYIGLINGQCPIVVNKFLSEVCHSALFKENVMFYHDLGVEISICCSRVEIIGMFEIHREHFISVLINKSQATKDRFLNKIIDNYQDACKRLNEEFQLIQETLLKPPSNTAELVQLKEYGLKLGTEVFFEMEDRLRESMNYILFCSDYVPLTSGQIKQNSITFLCYRRINNVLDENLNIIREKTKVFQNLLLSRAGTFKANLDEYEKEVDEFQTYKNAEELPKYLKKAQTLHKKFIVAEKQIREFNEEEEAFGWVKTSCPKIMELVEKLSPYEKLYENCADYKNKYQIWTEARVGTFEPEGIETDVETFHSNITKLSREFSSNPAPYVLTISVRLEVEQFQKHMPIVKTLGNPCLKERHWEKISEIVGFPLRMEDDLTLAKILDYGFEEYLPKFQIISDSATKENYLEIKLNQMVTIWKNVKFEIAPYRDSGTYFVTTVDKIQVLLDDHIVKMQTIKNSPYIKPFVVTIQYLEEKLILLQEVIDLWLLVQKTWVYLEPIFSYSDIQQLIPEESKRFNAVDKVWKDIMKAAYLNTSVLVVISIDKILERLGKCNMFLNMIQNGLGSYLEIKRTLFPRFFFLSNKEILCIISNTRDPKSVQYHLKKCFTGIEKLMFNEDVGVTAVVSELGEELHLFEIVDTGSKRGQVEKWLIDLEVMTKQSVKKEIGRALSEFTGCNFISWLSIWPQQVILVVNAIITANEIKKRLPYTTLLQEYLSEYIEKLELVISLVNGCQEMRRRYSLISVIIYFVQIRDYLSALISKSECERKNEFEMQMHYLMQDEDVVVTCLNISITYGYEYIGNYIPLIRTPTTESCYKSFFISYKYSYGVCLEGSTGAGKTDMVKDFAKTMARHYFVFSCSRVMDYTTVKLFFKGVVFSDFWFCLDNLDIVNPEGLRIIEQCVTRIQQAVQFNNRTVKFNGTDFPMSTASLVFATVGHKRSKVELPPLIHKFLRRVTCDQNKRQKVIETKFLIMGFKKFDLLVKKLVAIFELISRIFESKHYFPTDLRMLDTVFQNIEMLKNTRRSVVNDESLISKALEISYQPMFHSKDWLLFKKLLGLSFENQTIISFNELLANKVRDVCKFNNIIFDSNIFDKVEQLLHVMNYTTGVVLVGSSFGGKSTMIKVLASTLNSLSTKDEVEKVVINPRSITVRQLYGHQDQNTSKWTDGILSTYYRKFCEMDENTRKWVIFDGPMDASWIENLNSVLDRSRKLCLESGETILLAKNVNLIFETVNLQNASPWILSRCCVISVNSNLMKWEYLITSWLNTLPVLLSENHKNHINSMALRFCLLLFYFIDNLCHQLLYPLSKNNMITSLCDIFDCFMDDFHSETYIQSLSETELRSQLEGIFSFSCIWSLGVAMRESDVANFDIIFRALQCNEFPVDVKRRFNFPDELCKSVNKKYVYTIPDFATVFDYQYIKEGMGKWKLWSDGVATPSVIPRELQFHQIIVPTKTTIRNQQLISLLINNGKRVMFVGDTASGKTTDVTYFMDTKLDKNVYKSIFLNFATCTTGNSIQHLINCKLDKRKKGVYGPPLGVRYLLFIDDLHMAKTDEYETNSAIELLRHLIEFGHWYNLDDSSIVRLIDIQIMGALTTKSQEMPKTWLCPRYTKYFNIINNDSVDDGMFKSIFSKIMLWHLDTRGFSKDFDPCIDQIVDATLSIHRLVQKHLLPIPEKSHYIFNLRDFSKVIQGVILSVPEAIEDLSAMKRLWVHEIMRVYYDRIIDKSDTDWFIENLKIVTRNELHENLDILMQHLTNNENVTQIQLRRLIFCDFINPKADIRNYVEVPDMDGLQSIVEGYLTEYNNVNKKPMSLLLFSYAVEHVSRICRIIKQPQGHALLLGEYGSGKQSLARLAIHMCEYEIFETELSSSYNELYWRDDMKSLLFNVYTDQQSTFLCAGLQNLTDSMLDDISNLLRYAEIPEIFNADDKIQIYEKMGIIDNQRDKALQTDGSHEALFNLFLQRIKKQIHFVLVVNFPISEFRKFIYAYPSIIDCCTIDWFEPWPEETQKVVAKKLLHDLKLEYSDLQMVIEVCIQLHHYAKQLPDEIFEKFGMKLFFTQKSFIRLVTTFRDLFIKKQKELSILKTLYLRTLQRLSHIKNQLPALESTSKLLLPTINETRIQLEKLEEAIERERETETEAEISVNGAVTVTKNCEKKLKVKKLEYDKKIKEIEDVRDIVIENLKTLTSNDVAVLKTMKSPPKPIKLIAEALVYLKELKTDKGQESGRVVDDFWKPAIKIVNDSKFIDMLTHFEISNVSPQILKLLEERIISNDDFDAEKIRSFSVAAEVIYRWIQVLYEFNKVTKMDSIVRVQFVEAEEQLDNAKKKLASKEKYLQKVQMRHQSLLNSLKEGKNKLNLLEKKETICRKKIIRGFELQKILDKKKANWTEKSRLVEDKNTTLIGDTLLCSSALSYLTILPQDFRNEILKCWHSYISDNGLPCSVLFSLSSYLLDELETEHIKLAQVFDDECLIQNLAIIRNSSKYSLIMDPHGLMTYWISVMENENDLTVIRSDHEDYLRNLENAISSGHAVLFELVTSAVDPILYPLFEKQNHKNTNGEIIKLGKNLIECNPTFRLYLKTEMLNPNFSYEIYEKLCVVNCVTQKYGIENFLLKILVKKDRPDLETARYQSVAEMIDLKKVSAESELRILRNLSDEEDILENEVKVNCLVTDSTLMDDNAQKISEITSQLELFNITVSKYRACAKYFADLFEILENIHRLNGMYDFSLKWFENLLVSVAEQLDKVEKYEERLYNLMKLFLKHFHRVVSHSLVDTDKIVFKYLLAIHETLRSQKNQDELNFFITCIKSYVEEDDVNDDSKILERISDLDNLESFKGILVCVKTSFRLWKELLLNNQSLPKEWHQKLNHFQIMVLKSSVFSEDIITNIRYFTTNVLENVAEIEQFNLNLVYKESRHHLPTAFIIFNSKDPTAELFSLAIDMGIPAEKFYIITSGQFEEFFTCNIIETAKVNGSWIIIRNLQFEPQWFAETRMVIESLNPNSVHPDFRLWLILYPNIYCPEFILRNSFKVAYSDSRIKDLKSVKCEIANRIKPKDSSLHEDLIYKNILLLHNTLLKLECILPWIENPQFDEIDFSIALREITSLSNGLDLGRIYSVMKYCYGNKLSVVNDMNYFSSVVKSYWNIESLKRISNDLSTISFYELNHEIEKRRQKIDSTYLLHHILKAQRCESQTVLELEKITEKIDSIQSIIPVPFKIDVNSRSHKGQDIFIQSAIASEVECFNSFISNTRMQLNKLKRSLKGYCSHTEQLKILRYLKEGRIEVHMRKKMSQQSPCYMKIESLEKLLIVRYEFMKKLLENDISEIDLSAVEYARQFLSLNLLQQCLENKIPINEVDFDVWVIHNTSGSDRGPFYIKLKEHNLLLVNSQWDNDNGHLKTCELLAHNEMPPICLLPRNYQNLQNNKAPSYICPVYQILYGTNQYEHVISIALPFCDPDLLVKRGVKLILKYSYNDSF